jgi:exosortase
MTFRTRSVLFTAYCLGLVAVNFEHFQELLKYSRENVFASHILYVPFISLALIYRRRETIFSAARSFGRAGLSVMMVGLGFLLLGGLYTAAVAQHNALTLMSFVIVLLWIGGFLLFYGREAFRAAFFPLLFLGFMIPMPSFLLDRAILFLKAGSVETVAGLFTLTGTSYSREGFSFVLPSLVIEVADECSGIRSSIALLITSALAGHLFLETGWCKLLLAAVALPISIFKNGIRIVTLSLLAIHEDPEIFASRLHHEGGVLFFVLALGFLIAILMLLRKSERSHSKGASYGDRNAYNTNQSPSG